MFLVVVVPHPRRPVTGGREDQVLSHQDSAARANDVISRQPSRCAIEQAASLLVNLASVSFVDEVALAGGDVPLADGGVGRAGVHVNIVQCCARYVLRVAPGSREMSIRTAIIIIQSTLVQCKTAMRRDKPVTAEAAAAVSHFRKVFEV